MISIQHDHGVDVRDIHAGLDDRGRNQHIVFPIGKVHDDIFQLVLPHLAMSHSHRCLRNQPLYFAGDPIDGIHPVVQHIDLTSTRQLLFDGLPDHKIIHFHNVCLHRISVFRRFFNSTHIFDPGKRHMQSSRDRRCRKSQHIYILFQLFYFFFMLDAKPLFLVDDQKSQILELYIRRKQPVSSDQQIDAPILHTFQNSLLLRCGTKTRQHFYFKRKLFESILHCIIMLISQQSRRH